jgi:hypothetical protein
MKETLEIFKKIALPTCKDEKVNAIMDILSEYYPIFKRNIGIKLEGKSTRRGPIKVFVSHYDLVIEFEAGFLNNKTYKEDNQEIVGALDNTITNAVLIRELLKNGVPDNTMILFTDQEEVGGIGMANFLKSFGEEAFFINLDVTNDNWDFGTSIEFDFPNKQICVDIDNNIDAGFTKNREFDDLTKVLESGYDGFSYCLPTQGNCHSYNSRTTKWHLKKYIAGLNYILHNLNVSDYKKDDVIFKDGYIK